MVLDEQKHWFKKDDPNKRSQLNSHYRLSEDEKRLVNELRSRVKDQLTPRYDTDFNLYRWIKHVERSHTKRPQLDQAEKLLRNHLRYRHALNLDSDAVPTWDENPAFVKRILPRSFLHYLPSNNRFLWWQEFMDPNVEGIFQYSSREVITWLFWEFEYALRVVNEREFETGALSGGCMVIDVKNLALTPNLMLSMNNGHIPYVAQILFYEHFPELAYPVNIINVWKLLMVPYKMVSIFMPHDYTDKFRMNGSDYKQALLKFMTEDELPKQLGGRNPASECIAPIAAIKAEIQIKKFDESKIPSDVSHFQIAARKRKLVAVQCKATSQISWWIRSDAEIFHGLFFSATIAEPDFESKHPDMDILEKLDMIIPPMLLVTKMVPETGSHASHQNGTYYFLFCNKNSWIYRRHVQMKVELDGHAVKEMQEISI